MIFINDFVDEIFQIVNIVSYKNNHNKPKKVNYMNHVQWLDRIWKS